MKNRVIKAPKDFCSIPDSTKCIFLAGSIEQGQAENWQSYVEKFFKNKTFFNNDFILFNPRRDSWDSSWKQEKSNPNFYEQVNWELDALDRADEIIMYFDPKTKSPTSLLELGLYANSGKLRVICPKGFWRKGNVDIVCEKYNIPLYEDLLKCLVSLINSEKDDRAESILNLMVLRGSWELEDYEEAYGDLWDKIPNNLNDCYHKMQEYIVNTYDTDYIKELVKEES